MGDAVDGEYEMLFRGEFGAMVGLARLLGADDPENIVQEAFVRLHGRLRGLRDPGAARAYLRVTVVNLTRTRGTHLTMTRRSAALLVVPTTVDDGADRRAERQELAAALQQLTPRHREAVVLRYWLDLSIADIADAMGTRVGTAKSLVSRGLSALRVLLNDLERLG